LSEPSPLSLIIDRQDRLEADQDETRSKVDRVPVLEAQVELLTRAVDRLTDVVFQAAIAIVATGVLGFLSALILKGVIG
jgi:hypothetical protein